MAEVDGSKAGGGGAAWADVTGIDEGELLVVSPVGGLPGFHGCQAQTPSTSMRTAPTAAAIGHSRDNRLMVPRRDRFGTYAGRVAAEADVPPDTEPTSSLKARAKSE